MKLRAVFRRAAAAEFHEANTSVPVKALLGKIVFGVDPTSYRLNLEYTVFAVITTSDPYSPKVIARVRAAARSATSAFM